MIFKNSILLRESNSFTFSTYQTVDDLSFLTKKDVLDLFDQIDNLINKPKSVKLGKVIYAGPSSNLPRHKIKDYIEKNKAKKTSKISYADTILIDKTILKEFKNFLNNYDYRNGYDHSTYVIPVNDTVKNLVIKSLEVKERNSPYSVNLVKPFEKAIEKAVNICFRLDQGNSRMFSQPELQELMNYVNKFPTENYYYYDFYRSSKIINIFNILPLLTNPNINVVFDEDVLDHFNNDGIDLDEDYLNTLDNMFGSRQDDNIKLALEMLSNVNIEKYGLDIALLLNRHKDKFSWGSGITSNTGSFKIINKYFESKSINWRQDWRLFSSGLYKTYKNDERAVKVIEEFIRKNINNHIKNIGSSIFEVESFVIKFKN